MHLMMETPTRNAGKSGLSPQGISIMQNVIVLAIDCR